jgi:hypothetical protein
LSYKEQLTKHQLFLVGRGGVEPQDARIFSPVLYQLSYLPKGLGL